MLFSNEKIANYINNNFEPCWESLREVPVITLDFGKGNVIKRTLHGNIATYVCLPNGKIVDILPGIYSAEKYESTLAELVAVARTSSSKVELASYHETKARAPYTPAPQRFAAAPRKFDMRKSIIETPVENLLMTSAGASQMTEPAKEPILSDDVTLNESIRRRQIHLKLATMKDAKPADVTRWLYREVLHADLDDPYLGLGRSLFATYPFKESSSQVNLTN